MDLHQQNRFSIKINKILQDKKDIFRDIIGPSYFLKLGKEQHNCFSVTMKLYNNLYISENNQQNVAQFINYIITTLLSKNFLKIKTLNKNTEKRWHTH